MKTIHFYVLCFSVLYLAFAIMQFGDGLVFSNSLVEVSFEPKTINLRSEGKWVICYLSVLSEHYTVEDVDVSSILLLDSVMVDYGEIHGERLKLTFNRTQIIATLNEIFHPPQYIKFKYVDFRLTGSFFDGTLFSGSEEIKVIFS